MLGGDVRTIVWAITNGTWLLSPSLHLCIISCERVKAPHSHGWGRNSLIYRAASLDVYASEGPLLAAVAMQVMCLTSASLYHTRIAATLLANQAAQSKELQRPESLSIGACRLGMEKDELLVVRNCECIGYDSWIGALCFVDRSALNCPGLTPVACPGSLNSPRDRGTGCPGSLLSGCE